MSEKIQATHRDRDAYVYVRQSSAQQVRDHSEGRLRQYALAERAKELGFARVVTIDEDLGRSGSGAVDRPGFGRLLGAVCDGKVGAVLALEASRLARNNRDWHHLIDLCTLTDTLVIDLDGVYDPRLLNDRLLLGLKGSMSEFELGLLRQRAREAVDAMAARGDVIHAVPVGYVRAEKYRCEMDPDRQVQAAIRLVFSKFRDLGTARQVMLWFREEGVSLPVRPQGSYATLRWELPTYQRILQVLRNPIYAGAYVRGRTRSVTKMVEGRARRAVRHVSDVEGWRVLLRAHHEGYVSWDEFVSNQSRIDSNVPGWQDLRQGAPRTGAALLAGLLRCGRCGRRLRVRYCGTGGRVVRYGCHARKQEVGAQGCFSMGCLRIERAVVAEALRAVDAEGAQAAIDAVEQSNAEHAQRTEAIRLAVERARYEAQRCRRQYDAVDPQNRLVASELERRWEESIRQQRELEERLAGVQGDRHALQPEQREKILGLGRDLPALWDHPACPTPLKKRLLRALLEEILVDPRGESIALRLHWKGGVHTTLEIARNGPGMTRWTVPADVVALVRDLCQIKEDRWVATILNRLGLRTPRGETWNRSRVALLRLRHGLPCFDPSRPAEILTLTQAAARLGTDRFTLRRIVDAGTLPAQRFGARTPCLLRVADLDRPEVRESLQALRARRPRPDAPGQGQLALGGST